MRDKELNPFLVFKALAIHSINKTIKMQQEEEEGDSTNKRAQRDEHTKDEAIEEYVRDDPKEKPEPDNKDTKEEEFGRSDKAEKQPSDERDRYKDQ